LDSDYVFVNLWPSRGGIRWPIRRSMTWSGGCVGAPVSRSGRTCSGIPTPRGSFAAGVDLRTVAGRLGHGSGGATTLKVYAPWVDEADRRAASTIAGVMPTPVPGHQPRGPYEHIAEALREDIRSGRLQPGDQLPTVAELAVANTVAVGTAHRAMALLRAEGLIDVARGRRAVVTAA